MSNLEIAEKLIKNNAKSTFLEVLSWGQGEWYIHLQKHCKTLLKPSFLTLRFSVGFLSDFEIAEYLIKPMENQQIITRSGEPHMCIFFFFGNLFCYLSTFSEYVNRCHEGFSLETLSVVQFYNCLWIHTTCVGIRAKCFGVHKKGHGGFSLETLSAVQFYNCFRIHQKNASEYAEHASEYVKRCHEGFSLETLQFSCSIIGAPWTAESSSEGFSLETLSVNQFSSIVRL